jgi:hypothetical protein
VFCESGSKLELPTQGFRVLKTVGNSSMEHSISTIPPFYAISRSDRTAPDFQPHQLGIE